MSDKKTPMQIAGEAADRMRARAPNVLDAFEGTTRSILDVIEEAAGDDCLVESEVLTNVCEARSHWIAGNSLSERPPDKAELN